VTSGRRLVIPSRRVETWSRPIGTRTGRLALSTRTRGSLGLPSCAWLTRICTPRCGLLRSSQ
jgi:hypothetical protein